jgi:signal transduction histidine kinase
MARDLHDGLGGMLAGIKYSMNALRGNMVLTGDMTRSFERSIDMLDSSIHELRRVAHNLMPEALLRFGLDTALRDYCQELDRGGITRVTYQSIGLDELQADNPSQLHIYRIAQELVHNACKHAQASHVLLQVSVSGRQVSVTVEDDGIGFDPVTLKQATGIGLANLENRARLMQGRVDLQSAPGKGTSVHVELKLPEA